MERNVVWQPWGDTGIEHLRLIWNADAVIADSLLFRVYEHRPVRLRYEIRADPGWRVREVNVNLWDPDHRQLSLRSDGEGNWHDVDGRALPDLAGCIDVDLTATAFTNTLPIRRLRLQPGDVSEIRVAFIRVPDLSCVAVNQRYTCLDLRPVGVTYRYEGVTTGYLTELEVDQDGIVLDYPDNFRRIPLE